MVKYNYILKRIFVNDIEFYLSIVLCNQFDIDNLLYMKVV